MRSALRWSRLRPPMAGATSTTATRGEELDLDDATVEDADRTGYVEEVADGDASLQSRWTGGSQLATRAATGVLWLALTAGPLALAGVAAGGLGGDATPSAAAAPVEDRAGEQAAVQEFAERFVVTWLTTPRGAESALQAYVPASQVTLPERAWRVEQPATAGLERVGPGTWAVTVAVTVSPPPRPAGVPAPAQRRFFRAAVQHAAGGRLIALALPSPVAAPAAAAPPRLGYRQRVDLEHPAAVACGEFLAALLTSAGDVTRYVTPGTAVAPVRPAPYSTVQVNEVSADKDLTQLPPAPAAGDEVRVLVTAQAAADPDQQISVQYALTLAGRAGRWEIRAVDPAPVTALAPPTTAPPAPSGAPAPSAAIPPGPAATN